MAWVAQADIPAPLTTDLWFSPIIGAEVYIMNRSTNFYRYHIGYREYTALAPVPYANWRYPTPHYRNGRIYCMSDQAGLPVEPAARRISWYDIATGIWASSSQVPGVYPNIIGFCFQDDDTIWAWTKRNGMLWFKCQRYVISTDTWTEFANQIILNIGQARSVIMSANGLQVFAATMSDAGGPGVSPGRYGIYTIATDAYACSAFIVPGPINWCWCDDPLRLWFNEPAGGAWAAQTYGYLENDGVTEVHAYWGANAARNLVGHFGVAELNAIMDHASNVNPMTYFDGIIIPTAAVGSSPGVVELLT